MLEAKTRVALKGVATALTSGKSQVVPSLGEVYKIIYAVRFDSSALTSNFLLLFEMVLHIAFAFV